jgi:hypothetical protein
MDDQGADRILDLRESVEAHEADGHPDGVPRRLYRRLGTEYVDAGEPRIARLLLEAAERGPSPRNSG